MWLKKIKKYGTSLVLTFTKEELENRDWELGDIIDVSDIKKLEDTK